MARLTARSFSRTRTIPSAPAMNSCRRRRRTRDWWTRSVTTGQPIKRFKARDLLQQIAEATHQCGDPGMQFDTTINRWHTSKNTARINASNPCSEYMFLDDSACNLASLNLMKFVGTGRRIRRRSLPPRGRHRDHGAGDHGGQCQLPDREDCQELARLPAARARVREPGRAADVDGHALRQRCKAATWPPPSPPSCAARHI